MYESITLLADDLKRAHAESWQRIGQAGAFWSGAERREIAAETRNAVDCPYCIERKASLTPNIPGTHRSCTDLDAETVDVIHRLRTDPQRLTRAWFDALAMTREAYVELVSVVTSTVIIDTLHRALDLEPPELPAVVPGKPSGESNPTAVDIGAWVKVMDAPTAMAEHGLPQVPNIARAMGLVPSAVQLFFTTFRPHYSLQDIPLSISQAQAEYVASRTSSINECFY